MRDYLLVIKGQFRTTWRFAILLGWFRKNIPWNSGDEAFHFEKSISLSMSRCFYGGAGGGVLHSQAQRGSFWTPYNKTFFLYHLKFHSFPRSIERFFSQKQCQLNSKTVRTLFEQINQPVQPS